MSLTIYRQTPPRVQAWQFNIGDPVPHAIYQMTTAITFVGSSATLTFQDSSTVTVNSSDWVVIHSDGTAEALTAAQFIAAYEAE